MAGSLRGQSRLTAGVLAEREHTRGYVRKSGSTGGANPLSTSMAYRANLDVLGWLHLEAPPTLVGLILSVRQWMPLIGKCRAPARSEMPSPGLEGLSVAAAHGAFRNDPIDVESSQCGSECALRRRPV